MPDLCPDCDGQGLMSPQAACRTCDGTGFVPPQGGHLTSPEPAEEDAQNMADAVASYREQHGLPPAVPPQAITHPIAMSLHFDDADPVATCLVGGCGWHGHGDSLNDAVTAWASHVASVHRGDWEDT